MAFFAVFLAFFFAVFILDLIGFFLALTFLDNLRLTFFAVFLAFFFATSRLFLAVAFLFFAARSSSLAFIFWRLDLVEISCLVLLATCLVNLSVAFWLVTRSFFKDGFAWVCFWIFVEIFDFDDWNSSIKPAIFLAIFCLCLIS